MFLIFNSRISRAQVWVKKWTVSRRLARVQLDPEGTIYNFPGYKFTPWTPDASFSADIQLDSLSGVSDALLASRPWFSAWPGLLNVADRSLRRLDIVCWFWLSQFFSGISFNISGTLGGREIGNILSSGRKIAHSLLRLNVIGWGEAASRVKATDSRWTVFCTSGGD